MSESLLFGELLDHVREMIDERLRRFRPDLSRSTGVVPPGQLPTDGNTGGGYSPAAHASTHASGGSDPLTPAAIGAVADDDVRLSDSRTPTAHATSHQHGGSDEIATATPAANAIPKASGSGWLDSWLSTAIARLTDLTWSNISSKPSTFAPSAHASSHQHSGSDEIATATPAANAIPKAGGAGTIADGWLSALIARVADIVTHAAVVTGVHGLVNSGGYTLTIPATGTTALRGVAQTFSEDNNFQKILRLAMTSGGNGYGVRIWDGTTEYGNWQSLNLAGITYIFFASNRQFDGSAWQLLNSRAGGSLQVEDDQLTFHHFPASSTTAVQRFRVTSNGSLHFGKTSGLTGAGDVDIAGIIAGDKHIRLAEITAPAAPSANQVVLYAEDNGSGKTRLMAKFSSGAAQQIAIQP